MSETSGAAGRPPVGYAGSGRNGTLTREDARGLLEEWSRSDKTLPEFATEKGMAGSRLGWWRTKFAREQREGKQGSAASGPFVPVLVGAARTPSVGHDSGFLEVVLQGGVVVRVPPSFDERALRRLLSTLEGVRPC